MSVKIQTMDKNTNKYYKAFPQDKFDHDVILSACVIGGGAEGLLYPYDPYSANPSHKLNAAERFNEARSIFTGMNIAGEDPVLLCDETGSMFGSQIKSGFALTSQKLYAEIKAKDAKKAGIQINTPVRSIADIERIYCAKAPGNWYTVKAAGGGIDEHITIVYDENSGNKLVELLSYVVYVIQSNGERMKKAPILPAGAPDIGIGKYKVLIDKLGEKLLQPAHHQQFGKYLLILPAESDKRVVRAKQEFAPFGAGEYPLIFLDESAFQDMEGDGKDGWLLTNKNLYQKGSFGDENAKTDILRLMDVVFEGRQPDGPDFYFFILPSQKVCCSPFKEVRANTDSFLVYVQAFIKMVQKTHDAQFQSEVKGMSDSDFANYADKAVQGLLVQKPLTRT